MPKYIYLAIINPGIAIIGSPPDGKEGESYSFTFSADGGTSPYSWEITSGSLPDGLSLNSGTGEISGTPTSIDDFSFTVEVTDAQGNTASLSFEITISAVIYFDSWSHYIDFTVDTGQVSGEVSDYPCYIPLSMLPSTAWSNIKSDGGDLRASTTDGTELPMEVVWVDDGSEDGELHILMPACDVGETVRLYMGNAAASAHGPGDTNGRNAVWSDYAAVWHLQNSDASQSQEDSTGNGWNALPVNVDAGDSESAMLGRGVCLDNPSGATDECYRTTLEIDGTLRGMMKWIKRTAGSTSTASGYQRTDRYYLGLRDNGEIFSGYKDVFVSAGSWSADTWTWIAFRHDDVAGEVELFQAGASLGTQSVTTLSAQGELNTLGIGARRDGGGTGTGSFEAFLDGCMDEVRVPSVVLSDNYIEATFNNQNDPSAFWSVGGLQTNG